jgi:predicted nucleic acid-binding protein
LFQAALAGGVRLVTSNLVLAEVHRFVLFRAGIRAAAATLARIEGSRRTTIEFATRAHHQAAQAWLTKLADQVITYTDAVSFALVKATRCDAVIAFDADFVVAGFTVWRRP